MGFVKDECGQGAAEYILLFGAVMVIIIVALWIYRDYLHSTNPLNAADDIPSVRGSMK